MIGDYYDYDKTAHTKSGSNRGSDLEVDHTCNCSSTHRWIFRYQINRLPGEQTRASSGSFFPIKGGVGQSKAFNILMSVIPVYYYLVWPAFVQYNKIVYCKNLSAMKQSLPISKISLVFI